MNKNIVAFSDIKAGWMNMHVYDYINKETRKMRISYLQNFFDDLLMACKFLLSDITGIYEVYIDQEGFEASLKLYKYRDEQISVEIIEDFFEDELPYTGSSEDWDNFYKANADSAPTTLTYFNVEISLFVSNILMLIKKNKKDYNEGFVLSPADELDMQLFNQVEEMYNKHILERREEDEEVGNS